MHELSVPLATSLCASVLLPLCCACAARAVRVPAAAAPLPQVAPICVYTSGKGSSAAGLTAAVVQDANSREFFLEVRKRGREREAVVCFACALPVCERLNACLCFACASGMLANWQCSTAQSNAAQHLISRRAALTPCSVCATLPHCRVQHQTGRRDGAGGRRRRLHR